MENKGTKRVVVTQLRTGYFKAEYEEDYKLRLAGKLINDKFVGYGSTPQKATDDLISINRNIVRNMSIETMVIA